MEGMIWLGKKVDLIKVFEGEDRECCKNCNYFEQHYIRRGDQYDALCFGHCKGKRIRDRNAIDWCPMFDRKTKNK